MENREITARLKTLTKQLEELQKQVETFKKNRTRDRSLYCDNTMTPNRSIY